MPVQIGMGQAYHAHDHTTTQNSDDQPLESSGNLFRFNANTNGKENMMEQRGQEINI